jgi:hypothetical protein
VIDLEKDEYKIQSWWEPASPLEEVIQVKRIRLFGQKIKGHSGLMAL